MFQNKKLVKQIGYANLMSFKAVISNVLHWQRGKTNHKCCSLQLLHVQNFFYLVFDSWLLQKLPSADVLTIINMFLIQMDKILLATLPLFSIS